MAIEKETGKSLRKREQNMSTVLILRSKESKLASHTGFTSAVC